MTTLNLDNFVAPATSDDVKAERDRRNVEHFLFQDVLFQADPISRSRIDRAKSSALAARQAGRGEKGNLRWADPDRDFVWIALDNTWVPMDAETTIAFANGIDAREGVLILAANRLNSLIAAGQVIRNVRDPQFWPTA